MADPHANIHEAQHTEEAAVDAGDLLDAALDPEREEPWRYVHLARCHLQDVVDENTDERITEALAWTRSAADLSNPQPWDEVRRARDLLMDVSGRDPEDLL